MASVEASPKEAVQTTPVSKNDDGNLANRTSILGCATAPIVSPSATILTEKHIERINETLQYLCDNVTSIQDSLAKLHVTDRSRVTHDRNPIICFFCHKIGHIERDCKTRSRMGRKRADEKQAKGNNVVIGPPRGIDTVH